MDCSIFLVQTYNMWICVNGLWSKKCFKYAASSSSAFFLSYSFNQYAFLILMMSCFMREWPLINLSDCSLL